MTWNNLSAKPGAAQTLDYIFIREHRALQILDAFAQVAIASSGPALQLSDNLGLEAVVNLSPGTGLLAGLIGPLFQPPHRRKEGARLQAVSVSQLHDPEPK